MGGRTRRSQRTPVALAGLAGLAAIAGILAYALYARGVQDDAAVAGVVSALLAIPALGVPLAGWWLRPVPAPGDIAVAAAGLTGRVIEQWTAEAGARGLGHPEPMPVRWKLSRRDVMDESRLISVGRLAFSGRSDRIEEMAAAFRALKRRRLVILGGPGAGKTTLAIQLVLELAGSRQADEPVPVLLSLTSWDTRRYRRFHDWVARQLADDYPFLRAGSLGADAAGALARQSLVLPVLDGFDELSPDRRAAVLAALNRGMTDRDQLIITCRSEDYTDTVIRSGNPVTAAAVIEAVPLSAADAARYLTACLHAKPDATWRPVLGALRSGSASARALAEELAIPLGLWLMRTVYVDRKTDPGLFLDAQRFPDAPSIRSHLLAGLIPSVVQMYQESGNREDNASHLRRSWSPEETHRRLSLLAEILAEPRTVNFEWWRLADRYLKTSLLQLWTGLIAGFVAGLAFGSAFGWRLGLAFGLGTAAGSEIWAWLGVRSWKMLGSSGSPQVAGPLIVRRLAGQFGIAAVLGVGPGFLLGPRVGVVCGLGGVLGAGLTFASEGWTSCDPRYTDFRFSKPLLPRRLAYELVYGIVLGIGVAAGLTFGFGYSIRFGIVHGAEFGAGLGTAFALITWSETPATEDVTSSPLSTLNGDRNLTLLRMAAVGIGAGIPAGLAFGVSSGIVCLLAGMLIAAFANGSGQAWPVFVVATLVLRTRGLWPRRNMNFLTDAQHLGLLRTAGPAFQFQHQTLQDYLTDNLPECR